MIAAYPSSYVDYALHISIRHGFTYVVNPKVACSSIIWTLRRFELGDPTLVPEEVGSIHDRRGSPLLNLSEAEMDGGYDRASSLTFCFVRNPYDRLLSCYLNKIARPTRYQEMFRRKLGWQEGRDIDFLTFLSVLKDEEPGEMDPHWRPQWLVTMQNSVDYDIIGRFEHFGRDFTDIGRRISSDFAKYIYSEVRQATGRKPYDLLTSAVADEINRIYEGDFARFGYDRAPPREVHGGAAPELAV